jgi:hypothetical protein
MFTLQTGTFLICLLILALSHTVYTIRFSFCRGFHILIPFQRKNLTMAAIMAKLKKAGMEMKTECKFQTPMIVGEEEGDYFIDREDVVSSTFKILSDDWKALESYGNEPDKRFNPLHGYYFVSGGGKSFFIDNFFRIKLTEEGSLCFSRVIMAVGKKFWCKGMSDADFTNFAEEWNSNRILKIALTFNKHSTLGDKLLEGVDIESEMALRLLHR